MSYEEFVERVEAGEKIGDILPPDSKMMFDGTGGTMRSDEVLPNHGVFLTKYPSAARDTMGLTFVGKPVDVDLVLRLVNTYTQTMERLNRVLKGLS